jgi:hypothetical protein
MVGKCQWLGYGNGWEMSIVGIWSVSNDLYHVIEICWTTVWFVIHPWSVQLERLVTCINCCHNWTMENCNLELVLTSMWNSKNSWGMSIIGIYQWLGNVNGWDMAMVGKCQLLGYVNGWEILIVGICQWLSYDTLTIDIHQPLTCPNH